MPSSVVFHSFPKQLCKESDEMSYNYLIRASFIINKTFILLKGVA